MKKYLLGLLITVCAHADSDHFFYGAKIPWTSSDSINIDNNHNDKMRMLAMLAVASINSGKKYRKAHGLFEKMGYMVDDVKRGKLKKNDAGYWYYYKNFQKYNGKPSRQAKAISREFYDTASSLKIVLNAEKWKRTWDKDYWPNKSISVTNDWIFN